MPSPNDKLPPTTVNIPNKNELLEFAIRVDELLRRHGLDVKSVSGPMFTELCLHCVRNVAILRGNF